MSKREHHAIFLSTSSLFELSGYVTEGNFTIDSVVVYIYREQVQGTVELVDSIHSFGNKGKYNFSNMVPGTYYLRAKQAHSKNNFIDTYYGGSAVWINSKAIILRQDMLNKNIDLTKESSFKGNAIISGKVEYGEGDINFPIGEKAKNIPVLVLQNGRAIRRILTDENGNYKFSNLPIMNYNIVVDYPGKSMVGHAIKLNSNKHDVQNQNFVLEFASVNFMGNATDIQSLNNKTTLKVFPNPCKNELFLKNTDIFEKYSVMDYTGKEKINGLINDLTSIDVNTLDRGIYFLILEGFGERQVVKITKE